MKSSEFDRRFDAGDAVIGELDLDSAMRPRLQQKRVNVDFPFGWWSSSIVKPPALEHRYLSAKLSACDSVHFSRQALAS